MKNWSYSAFATPWAGHFRHFLLFFIVFLGISLFLGQDEVLHKPPQGIHLWRQTDGLLIAYNYYKDDIPVFKPRLNNLHCIGGYEACEFPLIYVIVALLYKLFGPHVFLFRLVSLSFVFLGFYSLFRTLSLLLHDMWQGLALSLIFFASSVLVFYSSNFLPDPVALGLTLTGWWFFFRYQHYQLRKDIVLCFLFFTLGTLVKFTFGINPLAVALLFLTERLWGIRLKNEGNVFLHPLIILVMLITTAGLVISWNQWMLSYNKLHHSSYLTTMARPFWEETDASAAYTWQLITEYWYTKYYYESIFHFFVLCLLAGMAWIYKAGRVLLLLSLYLLLGGITYFMLFYQQFADHDYYMINMLTVVMFPVITTYIALKQRFSRFLNNYLTTTILFVLAVLGIHYAGLNLERRYEPQQDSLTNIHPALYTISAELEPAGIASGARVIYIPDPSPNTSLYFLDRRGWTLPEQGPGMADTIWFLRQKGAEYLLIGDPSMLNRTGLQSFYSNKVLEYKGISVFKL